MNDIKTLPELLYDLTDEEIMSARTSVPGKIIEYSATTQTARVQLLVREKYWNDGDETEAELIIPDVPVVFPASDDDVYVTLPVKAGTLGELSFADRTLEKWFDSDGNNSVSIGDNYGHHELEDAFFTPGLRPLKRALDNISSSELVLRNEDTNVKLYNDGTIQVNNSSEELIQILMDLIDWLNIATVVTGIGAQPFTADKLLTLKGNPNSIYNRLDTFLKP